MRPGIRRAARRENIGIEVRLRPAIDRTDHPTSQAPSKPHDKKISSAKNRQRASHKRASSMNSVLHYKDLIALVRFSEEDDCFYGWIEGIDDLISFEGGSVEELKKAFRDAAEDYLYLCRRIGKAPQRSYKGSFNVRIAPELHRLAVLRSAGLGISLNQFVQAAIEKEVGTD
jgi:predicted HicB family RNase H-like nuclease